MENLKFGIVYKKRKCKRCNEVYEAIEDSSADKLELCISCLKVQEKEQGLKVYENCFELVEPVVRLKEEA